LEKYAESLKRSVAETVCSLVEFRLRPVIFLALSLASERFGEIREKNHSGYEAQENNHSGYEAQEKQTSSGYF